MNRAFSWPAALLGLAAACAAAPAQPTTPPSSPLPGAGAPGGLPGTAPAADMQENADAVTHPTKPYVPQGSAPAADMQEDIEILRRLLDGAFAETYGFHGGKGMPPPVFGMPEPTPYRNVAPTSPHADHPTPLTEGVYLKDYGVVYTVTLPPTGFDPLPAAKPGTGDKTPPDDWDRIRKEIHGETPEPETKAAPGHKPLSEVILKVLADNARHFTGLADGERITVAVTFRGSANCANCHQNPWPAGGWMWPAGGALNQFQYYPGTTTPAPGGTANPNQPDGSPPTQPGGTAPQAPGTPALQTDFRNAVLLGDLHLKQGKAQDAITAYQKAMDQLASALSGVTDSDKAGAADAVQVLLAAVDLDNKLATAYVQAGNPEAAGRALKQASDLAKKAEALTGAPATGNPRAPASAQALPSKLVVTASKKLLDDVSSGKLTFEAFCKAATVDYVNPPAEKK